MDYSKGITAVRRSQPSNGAAPVRASQQVLSMWPRERRQFRLGGTKHLDCVVREARCKADASTFRETLEVTLQQEIARMRDLGASPDAIAAFEAAAEVHVALCGTGAGHKDADSVEQSSDNPGRKNR